MIAFRGLLIWLIFILVESFNGAIRIIWLVPSLGEVQAKQISFVTGSILLVAIATLFSRWLQAVQISQQLRIGALWMVLTLTFEVVLGHVVFGYSWQQIAASFNLLKGELMPLELVILVLAPLIAARIRDTLHLSGSRSV